MSKKNILDVAFRISYQITDLLGVCFIYGCVNNHIYSQVRTISKFISIKNKYVNFNVQASNI